MPDIFREINFIIIFRESKLFMKVDFFREFTSKMIFSILQDISASNNVFFSLLAIADS